MYQVTIRKAEFSRGFRTISANIKGESEKMYIDFTSVVLAILIDVQQVQCISLFVLSFFYVLSILDFI